MSNVNDTCYFEKPGKQNSIFLLERVKKYIKEERTYSVVVGSNTGETGTEGAKVLGE